MPKRKHKIDVYLAALFPLVHFKKAHTSNRRDLMWYKDDQTQLMQTANNMKLDEKRKIFLELALL